MKKIFNYLVLAVAALTISSCSNDDDFTESIFDTSSETVDTTTSTGMFDKWLYENFVLPYNTEIIYRFDFPSTKLEYQLVPTDYKKAQMMAQLIKYLFYDVYTKYAGPNFLKSYAPRIINFIGSEAYSPTTNTRELGYASAGVKITLIGINGLRPWSTTNPYDASALDTINQDQIHTMHHEFSHILHQTKSYPVTYGQVTAGTYDGRDWQKRDSVEASRLGYVTHYGSSATYEDFVETLSCTITDSDCRWMYRIIDMCLNNGLREGDKERVKELIDSLGIINPYSAKAWNNFSIYKESLKNEETGVFESTDRLVTSFHYADVMTQASGDDKTIKLELDTTFTSFQDFLTWVPVYSGSQIQGMNAFLTKLDIATKWYKESWGLELFQLRREVRARQNDINSYIQNNVTIYD